MQGETEIVKVFCAKAFNPKDLFSNGGRIMRQQIMVGIANQKVHQPFFTIVLRVELTRVITLSQH